MNLPVDFMALLEYSPNPYVLMDREMTILWANRAYLAVTDRDLDDIEGKSMFDAFPSDPSSHSHLQLRASLERAVSDQKSDHLPLIRYDIELGGRMEHRYWSATHTPFAGSDGKCAYVLQNTNDVTELHRLRSITGTMPEGQEDSVETAILQRAEAVQMLNEHLGKEIEQLKLLFAQAPGFIAVLWGPDHVFTMANKAYELVVGRSDIVGMRLKDALPEVVAQGFVELLDTVYREGESYLGRHVPIMLAAGEDGAMIERFLDFIYQPIIGADGKVGGVFVQGHDVTEEVVTSKELRALNESLEARVEESIARRREVEMALQQAQKMESLGKLTGGVAHDFNNLLQVISGNIQLLQKEVGGNPKARERLENAMAGVERGAKLAAQLLAFGRRQPLEPKVLNVGRLVGRMGDMLRRVLGEEIEVETVIAGGLWNTLVDPAQIENALLNLAINARDAMEGAGRLTIEAGNAYLDASYADQHEEVHAGQYVMIAVTDTGSGMTQDVLGQVFEPFFTTKIDGHGSGLGLSMVYGFTKQSGGHIKIYSEPGQGTTVKLYLPRSLEVEMAVPSTENGPDSGGTETILVVEDDDAVRATVVEMLADLGYRVLKASDAASALAIVESGVPIDVLFTDVVMPGTLKSPELARKAKQALPDIAVLFTSGYTENAIVHGGRLDAGVELLSKPYTRSALARRLRQVLSDRSKTGVVAEAQTPAPSGAKTVLLVEDDPLIRMTTAEMVREFGFSVLESASAETALEILNSQSIDVLITDIGLAGMSGHELAWAVNRNQPSVKIILATGHSVSRDDLVPGASVLSKPFDDHRVGEALRSVGAL